MDNKIAKFTRYIIKILLIFSNNIYLLSIYYLKTLQSRGRNVQTTRINNYLQLCDCIVLPLHSNLSHVIFITRQIINAFFNLSVLFFLIYFNLFLFLISLKKKQHIRREKNKAHTYRHIPYSSENKHPFFVIEVLIFGQFKKNP